MKQPQVRRWAGLALSGALLAAGAAPHRHAGLADEASESRASQSVLTTHNPSSAALHWHAVLKVVQDDACWACRWSRTFAVDSPAGVAPALESARFDRPAFRASDSLRYRLARLSRGPPRLF